jgi:hypothetical protein
VRVESGGLRIIMDPFGEDHDILLMPWAKGWSIVVHLHGEDPVFTIRMTNTEATVVDDRDRLLGKAEYEPN